MSSSSSTSLSTVTSCKESSPVNLLYLPNDLLLSCLARLSRLYYPRLSLVSKRFHSLLSSTELYDIRRLLGCTESCLYVSILRPDSKPRWFTLCRMPTRITIPNPNLDHNLDHDPDPNPNPNSDLNPDPNPDRNPNPSPNRRWYTQCFRPFFRPKRTSTNHTKKEEKQSIENRLITVPKNHTKKEEKLSIENRLIAVPTHNYCPPSWLTHTTIGSSIYMIGTKYVNGGHSPMVFFMDCRSQTWREAPSPKVARKYPKVSILDGKIYVAGGTEDWEFSNLIECFDPKTQIWEDVPNLGLDIGMRFIYQSLAIEGNLYLFGDKNVVYKPKENRWDAVGPKMFSGWNSSSSCVIDNVLYCYRLSRPRMLEWYDSEARSWRVLKGVEDFLPNHFDCVKLVDSDGKIAVLWENNVSSINSLWCAEIAVKRSNKHEICGKIEWCDVVLRVSGPSSFFQFASVTV